MSRDQLRTASPATHGESLGAADPDVAQPSKVELQQVVESIPGLVYTMKPNGRVEFVNRPILEYFGRTAEELRDWAMTDAVHPEDLPRIVTAWTRSVETGEPHAVLQRLRRADGVYRWFQGNTLPVRDSDGQVRRWFGLLTDLDDLLTTQEALHAREEQFRLIVENIPGLVYRMTPSGEVDRVNRQTLEYFGTSLEELRGWRATDAVHPIDRSRALEMWEHAMESGLAHEGDYRLRRADGVYRWFHLRALPLLDAHGRIIHWYGLLTDIDVRKRTQRQLRRAIKARYRAALAERTRIAHDMHDGLLQDITGIGLQLKALLPYVLTSPELASERLRHIIESLHLAGRNAREAIGGMRPGQDSGDLVAAVEREAQRLAREASLALSVSVRGPIRPVSAALRDVACSITHESVTNAIKHARPQSVKVGVIFGRRRLRLSVSDDGGGFDVSPEPDSFVGHYGLSGMRERATVVGGALRVSSVPEGGTTITLDVPLPPEM